MALPSFKIEAIFDVFSLSKSLRGISNRHSPDSISFVAIMPYSAQEPSFPILTYKKKIYIQPSGVASMLPTHVHIQLAQP